MFKVECFFGSLVSLCLPTFLEGFWSRAIFLLSWLAVNEHVLDGSQSHRFLRHCIASNLVCMLTVIVGSGRLERDGCIMNNGCWDRVWDWHWMIDGHHMVVMCDKALG